MELKTVEIDGKVYAQVQDGKPVYQDGEKDIAFDVVHTTQKITALNGEAMGHRQAKEAAEAKLKAFEGIEDPAAALDALRTMKNLDDKKLVDAGEVDRLKAEIAKAYEDKLKDAAGVISARDTQIHDLMVNRSFDDSGWLRDNVNVPMSMVRATFSPNFTIEDGKMVARDAAGNQIYSREKPGELASFDEAIAHLVENHRDKDHILKSKAVAGTGRSPNGSAGSVTDAPGSWGDAKSTKEKVAFMKDKLKT